VTRTTGAGAHWFALPLMRRLAELATPSGGLVNVRLDEGAFHIVLSDAGPSYGHGPAGRPDVQLTLDSRACLAVLRGDATLPELIKTGQVRVDGDSSFAQALRSQ
jgi:ubiquinone biosynthesis protein UbiJ